MLEGFMLIEDIGSNFIPYDFKKIDMKNFSVKELFLLAESVKQKSILPVIEVMSNTIDVDINLLTKPDFFNLFYWQRFNSYTKTPNYLLWDCSNTVEVGGKKRICGYANTQRIVKTDLKVHYLQDCGFEPLDSRIDFPRVSILTNSDINDKSKDDPLAKLYYIAEWIKDGVTLNDKLDILKSQPDLDLYETALLASRKYRYGVNEYSPVKCEACGVESYAKIAFDATHFLP